MFYYVSGAGEWLAPYVLVIGLVYFSVRFFVWRHRSRRKYLRAPWVN